LYRERRFVTSPAVAAGRLVDHRNHW